MLTAGTVLQHGSYEIRATLDHNQFGITYLATHTGLDQSVWLLTLHPTWRSHPKFSTIRQNFIQRVRKLARIAHPHLARVLDSFEDHEMPFGVWEQPIGKPLGSMVQPNQPMKPAIALNCIRQVSEAVMLLHQHQWVHGAIAPHHIMIRSNPAIAVLTGIDVARSVVMAVKPEGLDHDLAIAASTQTDLRGLAATFYTLLTGRSPQVCYEHHLVDGKSHAQVLRQDLHSVHPHLHGAIEQAIVQVLHPDSTQPAIASVQHWLSLLPNVSPNMAQQSTPVAAASTGSTSPKPSQIKTQAMGTSMSQLRQRSQSSTSVVVQSSQLQKPSMSTMSTSVVAPGAKSKRRWMPIAFVTTALAAGLFGAGGGLALRLTHDSENPARPSLFTREQDFPPSDDWPGNRAVNAEPSGFLFEESWLAPDDSSADDFPYTDPYTESYSDYPSATSPVPEFAPIEDLPSANPAPYPSDSNDSWSEDWSDVTPTEDEFFAPSENFEDDEGFGSGVDTKITDDSSWPMEDVPEPYFSDDAETWSDPYIDSDLDLDLPSSTNPVQSDVWPEPDTSATPSELEPLS